MAHITMICLFEKESTISWKTSFVIWLIKNTSYERPLDFNFSIQRKIQAHTIINKDHNTCFCCLGFSVSPLCTISVLIFSV